MTKKTNESTEQCPGRAIGIDLGTTIGFEVGIPF